jgi:hairy orange
MAIRHVKHLEAHNKSNCNDVNKCELNKSKEERKADFKHGYQEATSEVMRFLVEFRGLHPRDELCSGLISHLSDHLRKMLNFSSEMSEIREKSAFFSSLTNVISDSSPSSGSPKMQYNEGLIDSKLIKLDDKELNGLIEKKKKLNRIKNDTSSSQHQTMIEPLTPSWASSVSSNSEGNYRSFKKGLKERFQIDTMKQLNGQQKSAEKSVKSADSSETEQDSSSLSKDLNKLKYSNLFSSNCDKIYSYKGNTIKSVPAFALHPNGSFYIPITLNPSLISFCLNYPETSDLFSVLHPVNIPVNFNYVCTNRMYSTSKDQELSDEFSKDENFQQMLLAIN